MPARKLRALQPIRVIRALEACGLSIKRQTGSHVIMTKPGLFRPVVIARHSRELPPGTIADILTQAEVSLEDFLGHL